MQEFFLSRQDNNINECKQKAPQNEVDDKTVENNRSVKRTVFFI